MTQSSASSEADGNVAPTSRAGQRLRSLPPAAAFPAGAALGGPAAARLHRRRLLQRMIETTLAPALVARYRDEPLAWQAFESQALQLARLLLLDSPQAASDLIGEVRAFAGSLAQLLTSLIEPAACSLGDQWHADECSQFDVALGLYHLQAAVRRHELDHPAPIVPRPRVALLAPQPGEAHVLGAVLHADLAWQAGWASQIEFPATDEALLDCLASRRFDLLDLSLSPAFARAHWVERMAITVTRARHASLNPNLIVVVSGRLFQEDGGAAGLVGADSGCRSAVHLMHLLKQAATGREATR